MKKDEPIGRPVQEVTVHCSQLHGRRLSLEEKILLMVRQYRAAQRGRQKGQALSRKPHPGASLASLPNTRSGARSVGQLEKAARV